MKGVAAIILAAGKGKRMASQTPKVCHLVLGKPLVQFPVRLCQELKVSPIVLVVSAHAPQARPVRQAVSSFGRSLAFAVQKVPRGTADAVKSALTRLGRFKGTVLILYGDVPLLEKETLSRFVKFHRQEKGALTFMTTNLEQPFGYGRVIRDEWGNPVKIVEERDATTAERAIQEVNVGLYAIESDFLRHALPRIAPTNAQKEYYLTDLVSLALQLGKKVSAFYEGDHEQFMGVNTPWDLCVLEKVARRRRIKKWISQGVRIVDPETIYFDADLKVAPGVSLYPGCLLMGKTILRQGSVVGPYAVVKDSEVGPGCEIRAFSVLDGARLSGGAVVGPFTHLRPKSVLKEGAKVGNFVEVKKTVMKKGAKANHLSYLGDAVVGVGANIGAGTITCNYDGFEKFRTVIGDGAFIGSDTQLVAPVRVGKNAMVGAGTTVTRNVAPDALVLSRTNQTQSPGWARRWRQAKKRKKGGNSL